MLFRPAILFIFVFNSIEPIVPTLKGYNLSEYIKSLK